MNFDAPGEISDGDNNLFELTGNLLADARAELTKATTLSVPIAQLATLGAGVASLVPALNTVTQTISFDTSGLYRIANQAVGDTLKIAKNGNSWGALKTADGGSKLAQLQSAGSLTATSQSVTAINPATMMMAVACSPSSNSLAKLVRCRNRFYLFWKSKKNLK